MLSCIFVDEDFLVNCYNLKHFPEIEFEGCEMKLDWSKELFNQSNWFNMRISYEERIENHKVLQANLDCSNSLSQWLEIVQDPNLFWYHYNTNWEPLSNGTGKVEKYLFQFQDRTLF